MVIFFSFIMLFLTACSEQEVELTASHRIYYVNSNDTKLVSEGYEPKAEATEELPGECRCPFQLLIYRGIPGNQGICREGPDDCTQELS